MNIVKYKYTLRVFLPHIYIGPHFLSARNANGLPADQGLDHHSYSGRHFSVA